MKEKCTLMLVLLQKYLVFKLILSNISPTKGKTLFYLKLKATFYKITTDISHASRYKLNFAIIMKLDPLLQKQLERRFQKDKRIILFTTRVKMLIHIDAADWQENCSGLLILYQKKYTYGFCIVSTQNLDINFDFELYSNFPNYTKYIGDLRCLIFLAPSQKHCLKIMFVMESKGELSELKKQIDKIYNITSKSTEIDFLNQPEVQEILKKVPVDENLLVKDLTFRNVVEEKIKEYFNKTSSKKENKKSTGFKYYALGREEWKVDLEETNYLRAKFETEIIDELTQLQKQARIRSPTK